MSRRIVTKAEERIWEASLRAMAAFGWARNSHKVRSQETRTMQWLRCLHLGVTAATTNLSLTAMARLVGKTHTSVIASVKEHNRRLSSPAYRAVTGIVTRELRMAIVQDLEKDVQKDAELAHLAYCRSQTDIEEELQRQQERAEQETTAQEDGSDALESGLGIGISLNGVCEADADVNVEDVGQEREAA